ncbi:phospholipid phosphatase-related protein type 5-like isoform X1, partial [Lates japonicus]
MPLGNFPVSSSPLMPLQLVQTLPRAPQWWSGGSERWFCFERDKEGKRKRRAETTSKPQNGGPLQEQIFLEETETWRRQWSLCSSTACNTQRFKMIDSRLPAQRRAVRNLPADRGQQKTSTYIVPCFLFVE